MLYIDLHLTYMHFSSLLRVAHGLALLTAVEYLAGNELSTFYPPSNAAGFKVRAATSAADLAETRLIQYREAVQQGYAKQRQLAVNSAVGLPRKPPPGTVLADVERHAAPLPAAVVDRFSKYHASLVDERKYRRLRTMV